MGAKEQSGRTWPSIFWARGTLVDKRGTLDFFLYKTAGKRRIKSVSVAILLTLSRHDSIK